MKTSSVHEELVEHEWLYNALTHKYSIEFLVFPKELPGRDAYKIHKELQIFFEDENNEDKERIIH